MELAIPARRDARLKAGHNLPSADCFAAALAPARKASLVASDKVYEREETTLKIPWA
jgi:predicted nucleic acid-binding protein